ncbi:MAG: TolC family protein, partial [Alphaproteobacteria bacterium]|nr:TolC family protein [Alphaproteobacteria bacterium]
RQADSVKIQFDAGALTRTDLAQSQARLAGAQSDLTAAQSQLAISRANFLQAIGREAEVLEQEPPLPPGLPTDADQSIVLALQSNPAILSARQSEVAANYAVNDAIGAMLPSFSIQGQYGVTENSPSTAFSNGVPAVQSATVTGQLTVPLYAAGADQALLRQAKELHSQALLNVSVSDRQVRDAVAIAWAQFEAAEASIASNEAAVRANTVAFEGVQKEQQVGGRTILDVLNAEQELLNASVLLVSAKRNAEVAAYQVLASVGALTAKNLGLKVKLYDPVEHYDSDAARWIGFGD